MKKTKNSYAIYRFSNKTKQWSHVYSHEDINEVCIKFTHLITCEKKNKLNCFIVIKEHDGHIDFVCYCEKYFQFVDIERLIIKSGLSILYDFKSKVIPILSIKEEEFTTQLTNEINLWIINEEMDINDVFKRNQKKMKEMGIKRNYMKLFRYSFLNSEYYTFMRDMIKIETKPSINMVSLKKVWGRIWKTINGDTFFGENIEGKNI